MRSEATHLLPSSGAFIDAANCDYGLLDLCGGNFERRKVSQHANPAMTCSTLNFLSVDSEFEDRAKNIVVYSDLVLLARCT